jgi:hypothetical protein
VPPDAVRRALQRSGLTAVNRDTALGLFSEYTAIKP